MINIQIDSLKKQNMQNALANDAEIHLQRMLQCTCKWCNTFQQESGYSNTRDVESQVLVKLKLGRNVPFIKRI